MTYKHLLVPILGNACDQQALDLAASVAESQDTHLSLIYVVEVAQEFPLEADLPAELEAAERALEAASRYAVSVFNGTNSQVHPELLQARAAGPAIVDEAVDQKADVIVMALRNQRKHGRPTVGDTVPYVLKNAPCEVLIRRQPPVSGVDRCDWAPDIDQTA